MERARVAGEISADRGNLRLQSLAGNRRDFVILPPGFGYVAIGDHASAWSGDESCAENIELHFRAFSLERQYRIAFTVLYRFAVFVKAAVTQPASGSLVVESDGNMQQANGLDIQRNNALCGLALRFEALQARIGLLQLFLQAGRVV